MRKCLLFFDSGDRHSGWMFASGNHEYSLDVSLALEMTTVNCSLTQHNGTHDTVFNYAYFLECMQHKSKELLLLQNKDH